MANEDAETSPKEETDDRTALQVTLDTGRIDRQRLEDTFERLHSIHPSFTLEVRLAARDESIEYYVVTDPEYERELDHVLRRLFPNETSIETTSLPSEYVPEEPTAGLELYGAAERRNDWQTQLKPVVRDDDSLQLPLAAVVDTLADADATVVYQALLTPKENWQVDAQLRIDDLMRNEDTYAGKLGNFISEEYTVDPSIEDATKRDQERIKSIRAVDKRRSFVVNVRAIADGPDAEATLEELGHAFQPVHGEFYRVFADTTTDEDSVAAIADRLTAGDCIETASLPKRIAQRIPITPNNSRSIITDPDTAPNFCLLDGASLTNDGQRAMQATPDERTGLPHPDGGLLEQYHDGMLLGTLLDDDDTPLDRQVSLPPSLQPLHAAWFGKTGSGKSTAIINAILENYAATDGADILIDPKGDGMPVEYLQVHYAKYGDLEDVYYFDCAEVLPAISFFDIRDQLADGIDRTTAVEGVVDHYVEILVGIMGRDRFEQAVRSPDIIKYLVKAMFDPVHGADAFAHRELQDAARRMHETRDAPPVVDPQLQQMLSGVAANSKRSFDELMQGVANRIEKIPLDDRLGQLFNHVPESDDPHFDFREVVDEDAVVIVDTGGLRTQSQRALTLVLLSNLWTALQRRSWNAENEDLPLVNLYLEEAASFASSGLLSELLAQSRSFGLSVTLAMQFPKQLERISPDAYAEVLNNISTIVTGNVAVDRDLTRRLATQEMPPAEVENRLGALRRGQWVASLPSGFGVAEPRPFILESAPIPPGHPDGPEPFGEARQTAFEAGFDVARDRSRREYGLDIALRRQQATSNRHQGATEPDAAADTVESKPDVDEDARLDSALPYTDRMPDPVEYDAAAHALVCSACESRFDPTSDGMRYAIECCHRLEDVDRDDVPICELNLKLSTDERRQSAFSDAQLRFLQAVFMAHQCEFDPDLEYSLIRDSMVRLQEYVGVGHDAVQELVDAGLLAVDCTYPHKLYTVTADGRSEAKIEYAEGISYGEGQGDLGESSLHVLMVKLLRRYLQQAFVDDPDSPAETAKSYHEIDGSRLDAVALDGDGEVVVTAEAERSNHDTRTAVPDDFDKMADTDPEHAIWLVKNRDACHDVLKALHDPPDDEPRVDKVYSRNTAPQQFKLDYDGLTELHTLQFLRDTVLEE